MSEMVMHWLMLLLFLGALICIGNIYASYSKKRGMELFYEMKSVLEEDKHSAAKNKIDK